MKRDYVCVAPALALLALSFGVFSGNALATTTADDTTTITIRPSCSMTATVTSEHTATMMGGTYSGTSDYPNGIGATTIQTFCNDANGYAIYAIGYTNNEEGNTVLKGGTGLTSSDDIVTGTATSGSGDNDVSNWAMKLTAVPGIYAPTIMNGFGSFSEVPSSYTEVAKLDRPTDLAASTNIGSTITTTYAAYISNAQPAGTYTGQVKYVLVHPDYNVPSARIMQNIAEWEDELLPEVQVTAVDNRDNTEYTVAKLKDGNIWMLDDLALGSDSVTTLTSADTNMSASSWDLPASVSTDFHSFTTAQINSTNKNTTQPLAMEQSGTSGAGVYYNYCAATAGTYCYANDAGVNNATDDICPKGWRMPTGGSNGEFQALRNKYNSGGSFATAFRASLSGLFYNSSADSQGSLNVFWSSSIYDGGRMYSMRVSNSEILPQNDSNRSYGFAVRCIRETLAMQDATTSDLAELMPIIGDTKKLRDNRDNTEYIIGKLADGNYWMLDNLALDPATMKSGVVIDSSNSNVAEGSTFTLPASTPNDFVSYTEARIVTGYKNNSVSLALEQSGTGKVGVYYNYCAATAGTYCKILDHTDTDDAEYDICPKGWRMPTGGSNGEYRALRNKYASNEDFVLALRAPYSAYFHLDHVGRKNASGGYWAKTYGTSPENMGGLWINPELANPVGPTNTHDRKYGFPMRCIYDC